MMNPTCTLFSRYSYHFSITPVIFCPLNQTRPFASLNTIFWNKKGYKYFLLKIILAGIGIPAFRFK